MQCRPRLELVLPLVAMACGSAACGPRALAPAPLHETTTAEAFGATTCSAVRVSTEPDLTGWDAGSRANLAVQRRRGVVAVRYQATGCNVELEVLWNCVGAGEYAYVPYAATESKFAHDDRELFAELPLGASRLGAKLRGGRVLRTDYMLAGMHVLPVSTSYPATDLSGGVECARATHVVSKLHVGAFAMVAGESRAIEAGASAFGAGAGAKYDERVEHVAREGIAEGCTAAHASDSENPRCAVPLRLGLLRIQRLPGDDCPRDSTWNASEKRCVSRRVVTKIDCPPGTTLSGAQCVALVVKTCPAGFSFAEGQGCVPIVEPRPATPKPAPPTPAPAPSPRRDRDRDAPKDPPVVPYVVETQLSAEIHKAWTICATGSLDSCRDACTAGDQAMCVVVGRIYTERNGDRTDARTGAAFLDKACAAGRLDACLFLGKSLRANHPRLALAAFEPPCAGGLLSACEEIVKLDDDAPGRVDPSQMTDLLTRLCRARTSMLRKVPDACRRLHDLGGSEGT